MARLYDIREELTRQLSHLQKQADAAEKYRTLKTEERQTKIELLARRWQTHQQQVSQYELLIQQQEGFGLFLLSFSARKGIKAKSGIFYCMDCLLCYCFIRICMKL